MSYQEWDNFRGARTTVDPTVAQHLCTSNCSEVQESGLDVVHKPARRDGQIDG